MRQLPGIAVCALLLLSGCQSKKPTNNILTPSNLPSQLFTIDPSRDTVLRTSHATILRINKATFRAKAPVIIEIKEVYTPAEILLSGLTTQSDGRPLRSAGMLYFSATVEGDAIAPEIPIETTIPAQIIDPEMQVFKGEFDDDSTINWVEPALLDTTEPVELIAQGKAFFSNTCAKCHHPLKAMTGPPLKGVQYRGPWNNPKNILDWVHNPALFMDKNLYTQNLKNKYGSMMPGYPQMTRGDLQALFAYLNSFLPGDTISFPQMKSSITDTTGKVLETKYCVEDTIYESETNTFPEYDTTFYPIVIPNLADTSTVFGSPNFRNTFREGYDFRIEANGWYNIDAYLKEDAVGVKKVKLVADIKAEEDDVNMHVYLFIPTERVMYPSARQSKNQYFFEFENGMIPLPLRFRAILFAYGSVGTKLFYGASEFTIGSEQTIPVVILETTKEGLKNALYAKNINGVSLEAIEKKMIIRKIPCNEEPDIINKRDSLWRSDSIN